VEEQATSFDVMGEQIEMIQTLWSDTQWSVSLGLVFETRNVVSNCLKFLSFLIHLNVVIIWAQKTVCRSVS